MLTVATTGSALQPGELLLDLGCGVRPPRVRGRPPRCSRRGPRPGRHRAEGRARHVRRHGRGRRGRRAPPVPARCNGDATDLPFADGTFDHVIASEVLEHIADDAPRWPSWPGCSPGRHDGRHRAGVAGREGVLGAHRRVPRAVRGRRPRAHLLRARAVGRSCGPRACSRSRRTTPTPCTRPYWWLRCAVGPTNNDHPLVRAYRRLLEWDIVNGPRHRRDWPSGPSTPCSARSSWSTPKKPRMSHRCLPDVPGIVSPSDVVAHGRRDRRVAAARRDDPVVPRRPRRPVEPRRGGDGARRRRARSDAPSGPTNGSPRCSAPTARGTSTTSPTASSRTSSTPTCARTSPPACGTTGCCTSDDGFVETMWPVVERAIDFVLELQTPARRDHLGPPRRRHAVVVRAAHRFVVDLPLAALRDRARRAPRPRAPRLGAVRRPPGRRRSARSPRRSRRSTAGRWTGTTRCSPAWSAARRRRRSAGRAVRHVRDGRPGRALRATGRGSPSPRRASARWPTPSPATPTPRRVCSRGPGATATTTAATGPASSIPTASRSPTASARPTPAPRWCSPPTAHRGVTGIGAVPRPRPAPR